MGYGKGTSMADRDLIDFKLVSTPDVIQELEDEGNSNPEELRIESSRSEEDPTYLQFGFGGEVVAVLGLVKGAFLVGQLVFMVHRWVTRRKAIVIQTPYGRVEFLPDENLTVEEVRERVRLLAGAL
jgi:hypothetical protein